MGNAWNNFIGLLGDALKSLVQCVSGIGIIDVLDILIVAFLIYQLMNLVRQTHTGQLAKGIMILFIAYAAVKLLQFPVLSYVMDNVLQVGFIALIIVFQPELRRALEQVGRTNILTTQFFRSKRDSVNIRERWQNAVVEICDAAERLAETRTGALMVLERQTNLSEVIGTGTRLDSSLNAEMLCTIFYVGTPLHDGAVVVRDARVEAAGCFLPLSANLEISKDMGTRHRAALGMSENSDAVVVVVSEETGIISLAKNGVLIRRLDRQNLFNLLEGEMVPPEEEESKKQPFWRKKNEEN